MILAVDVIEIVLVVTLVGLVLVGVGSTAWASVSEWAARRRRGRQKALERRMRAQAHCTACGAIGRVEFRRRAAALLHELGESDAGAAVIAIADYGRRASRPPAS